MSNRHHMYSSPFQGQLPASFAAQRQLGFFGALRRGQKGLSWEGLPYEGPILDYKDDDPEERQPQLKYKGCAAQFDLSNPGDMEEYRALTQKICEGEALQLVEERIYDTDIKSWRILVRWAEPYYSAPEHLAQAAKQQQMPKTVLFRGDDDAALRRQGTVVAPGTPGVAVPLNEDGTRYVSPVDALKQALRDLTGE